MSKPSTLEICKTDLFLAADELHNKYGKVTVDRILRLRDMYTWKLGYPDSTDRKFVDEIMGRYGISQSAAYTDLAIIKQLLPMLGQANRDYHRWRANEMAMETYQMAKKRKDTKTMAQITKTYSDINRCNVEDEMQMPYDEIVPQIFAATDDPTVLGIKPITNIDQKIKDMIAKYRAETIDIEDVEAEEFDLEEKELFGTPENNDNDGQESIL